MKIQENIDVRGYFKERRSQGALILSHSLPCCIGEEGIDWNLERGKDFFILRGNTYDMVLTFKGGVYQVLTQKGGGK